MSYLLELLGNGLLGELVSAFENQLPECQGDDAQELAARRVESPQSEDLALRHGMACLRQSEWISAKGAFEDAARLCSVPVLPALGLACVYDELGQLDEAVRNLAIAHKGDPNDPAILFALGFCRERAGAPGDAEKYYQRAIAICPRLRNGFERRAAIAIQRRDLISATRHYESLAEIEPDDMDIIMGLATLYLETGRAEEAVVLFERALLIEPQCMEGTLEDAELPAGDGQIGEAIHKMEGFVQKYPGIADFHVHLGDLYAKAGQDAPAVAQYRMALDLHPRFLEAAIKLGTQHLRRSRHLEAARTFNRAVELNDRLIAGYVGLGVAQATAGRAHEAKATLDLAASIEPNTTLLFGEAMRLQLKAEGASRRDDLVEQPAGDRSVRHEDLVAEQIERHRQALLLAPNQADLHYRYGLLLRQVGQVREAAQAFRNAVQVNPGYSKAFVKLGICLTELGDAELGLEAFRESLSLRDDSVDLHYQLGLLFAQRNQFDLAIEQAEHSIQNRAASVRANVALALQNLGMLDRAEASWRSICELSRSPGRLVETPRVNPN